MITYYENQLYTNTFNQYYSYYYQYFTQGDSNTALSYAQQAMQGKTIASYYDGAIDMLKEVLILCEAADAAGVKLEADDIEAVESLLAQYEGAYKQNFGAGVNKSDIRKAVELQALASKYYEQYVKDTKAAVTDADISAFIEENKADFYIADYLGTKLSILAEDYEDDKEGFAAAKALIDEYAGKFENAKTAEEFKTLIVEYTVKSGFDALVATEIDTDLVPDAATLNAKEQEIIDNLVKVVVKGETISSETAEEGTLEYALLTIEATLKSNCEKAISSAAATQAYMSNIDEGITDDIKWIIASERAEGDTYKSSVSDETEYTFNVYMIEKPLHINDTVTRNVGHILISANEGSATEEQMAEAEKKANDLLAEYLAGAKTEESFEELGWANTSDSNVFYDNVTPGYMVDSFNDWLFDEARKDGDTGVVKTEFGFHVMLYRGEETLSDANAKSGIVSERYSEFLKANEGKLVINEKAAEKYGA
jgi:hypothetical protein